MRTKIHRRLVSIYTKLQPSLMILWYLPYYAQKFWEQKTASSAQRNTPTTAIFIPTFMRPHKIKAVLSNIRWNTDGPYKVYFIVEKQDMDTIHAVQAQRCHVIINQGGPTYAACINTAYRQTQEPFFFVGADDLKFYPHWLPRALQRMRGKIQVVGTNDLHNDAVLAGKSATHNLICRKYIQQQSGCVDQKGIVLHEYQHNFTDTELVATAQSRGAFAPCLESVVEHLHWRWQRSPHDSVYDKGERHFAADARLYQQRKHLWEAANGKPKVNKLRYKAVITKGKYG